jgi:3-deoxy-D-arabino-heptulosonate 7-phosphate (DAHP) synthase
VHPDPDRALSDKETQYRLDKVEILLESLKDIYNAVNK